MDIIFKNNNFEVVYFGQTMGHVTSDYASQKMSGLAEHYITFNIQLQWEHACVINTEILRPGYFGVFIDQT